MSTPTVILSSPTSAAVLLASPPASTVAAAALLATISAAASTIPPAGSSSASAAPDRRHLVVGDGDGVQGGNLMVALERRLHVIGVAQYVLVLLLEGPAGDAGAHLGG